MGKRSGKPWLVLVMGTLLMLCLGTVYAWSYFQTPIMKAYGWNNSQVSLAFSIAIFFLGASAAMGGIWLPKVGPRRLALVGGILFGAGHLIAALALSLRSLPLLYAGYGLVGGCGLGLCYVTPVATVAKWFPDRKGLATGTTIMGFGLGALLMSKLLAPLLLAWTGQDLVALFLLLGAFFFAVILVASQFMVNPATLPQVPPQGSSALHAGASRPVDFPRFVLLWIMFFCNIAAGIAIVGFQSPLFQDQLRLSSPDLPSATLASFGATLIAVTSLFNGLGRFVWASLSDRIGRIMTFRILLGSEFLVFAALLIAKSPWLFAALLCWVLFCYGGGFGTMPATISESFGPARMAAMYGAVLTAWSVAGMIGPQFIAYVKDHYPADSSTLSFLGGAFFVATGLVVSFIIPRSSPR